MLRRNLTCVILLLSTSVTAAARQAEVEYGHAAELEGVTRLYVSTGVDMKAREFMVKELLKRLPRLEIARTPEAADVHLVYRSETLYVPGARGGKSVLDVAEGCYNKRVQVRGWLPGGNARHSR